MADSVLSTLNLPVTPSAVVAHGLIAAVNPDPIALPGGSSHLTFPNWVPTSGPSTFIVQGGEGKTLTGMGGKVIADLAQVEYAIAGMIVAIVVTIGNVLTSADDLGSPAGTRFSSAIEVAAGQAMLFVLAPVGGGGENQWVPIVAAS